MTLCEASLRFENHVEPGFASGLTVVSVIMLYMHAMYSVPPPVPNDPMWLACEVHRQVVHVCILKPEMCVRIGGHTNCDLRLMVGQCMTRFSFDIALCHVAVFDNKHWMRRQSPYGACAP